MRLVGWMLTAALGVAAPAGAQPDWYERWRPDSLELARDAVPIPLAGLWTDCDPPGTQVVRDSADAAEIRRFGGCDPLPFPALGRELYVHVVMTGDCHARHSVDAFRSDSRREYRILIVDRYGGCRAGRSEERWFRLPPLPDGWTVAFTERRIDDRNRVPWSTDSLYVAADAVPIPAEWEEWIDCDPGEVRVLRDRVDAEAIRHAAGCDPSAFPALGRDLYVRVLPGPVCDALYDVRAWRSELRGEYRVVRMHRSRACRGPGGGPRWYRLPPLPDGWTVAFTDG
ncbi:MAG TPA: hypothetical protein VF006_30225 [Longimicrobium sp.]